MNKWINIVTKDIIKIVDKFDAKKSAGNDNIGNFIVKRVISEILEPLTSIFNLSISNTGVVPKKLIIAI